MAKAASAARSTTPARVYAYDTLLQGLAPDLQDMPRACGRLVEAQEAMVRPRSLPRHLRLAAADQPHLGNGVIGGATRPGGDEGGASVSEPGNVIDARGVDGFGQGHSGQDGREADGQPSTLQRPQLPVSTPCNMTSL
jgi:hypothetical protein